MNIRVNVNDDFESILVCAIRYALGRSSYMPSVVTGYINPFVNLLSDKTLGCIERDISSASSYGDEKIDKPLWMNLLNNVREEIEKRLDKSSEGENENV